MSTAELTLILTAINSLAVPLLLAGHRWTRRIEKRLTRLEHRAGFDPLVTVS